MRKLSVLGALLLVGLLGAATASPSGERGTPLQSLTTISQAEAQIGRGGGGGRGGEGTGSLRRAASWLQSEIIYGFFIVIGIALCVVALQRNAGAAVAILVAAVVIGAFLLVPDQVESLFRSIYEVVL